MVTHRQGGSDASPAVKCGSADGPLGTGCALKRRPILGKCGGSLLSCNPLFRQLPWTTCLLRYLQNLKRVSRRLLRLRGARPAARMSGACIGHARPGRRAHKISCSGTALFLDACAIAVGGLRHCPHAVVAACMRAQRTGPMVAARRGALLRAGLSRSELLLLEDRRCLKGQTKAKPGRWNSTH